MYSIIFYEHTIYIYIAYQRAPLVRANVRMHGRGAQSRVRFVQLVGHPILPDANCGVRSQYIKVWVLMESLKRPTMEGSLVINIYIYICMRMKIFRK